MTRNIAILLGLLFLAGILIVGCSNEKAVQPQENSPVVKKVEPPATGTGNFTIEAKYSYIRSYPQGGGIFILRLVPDVDLVGDVALSLNADRALGAALDKAVINADLTVFEITVHPKRTAAIQTYTLELTASNATMSQTVSLDVEMINWDGTGVSSIAQDRMADFVNWLETEHPELGDFSDRTWFSYMTYPGILIVEHYTFLDADWEFRLCHHVMIPPYDWAQMMIRERGKWHPTLAAYRESDGTIYEIPVQDYPTLYGY
ncbi:MAG: hypothetical protein AB1746_02605 [Candidatus Zixiibacteriota bacterium]